MTEKSVAPCRSQNARPAGFVARTPARISPAPTCRAHSRAASSNRRPSPAPRHAGATTMSPTKTNEGPLYIGAGSARCAVSRPASWSSASATQTAEVWARVHVRKSVAHRASASSEIR